jgi:hypothetical protein
MLQKLGIAAPSAVALSSDPRGAEEKKNETGVYLADGQ